jgi:nucleoside-diphosphate-sugar epimerase
MTNTVLVLGARGRLGGAVAQAFAAAGWRVLAQRRAGGAAPAPVAGIEWVLAEATDTATLQRAAAGARVVVHAMNPAYTAAAWRAQASGLMQAAIDVAAGLGAVLLFPGNVYNFGKDMPTVLAPDTPQRPGTEKGRIRVDLEQQLAQATRSRGIRAVVIRAGDFFGAGNGSWLDQVIVKKLPQGHVTWPGTLDAPHAWAYLPDLARAFVRVAETTPEQMGALRMPAFRRPHGDGPRLAGRTDRGRLGAGLAAGRRRAAHRHAALGDDAAAVALQRHGGLAAGNALPLGRAPRAGWRGVGAAHRRRAPHALP